MNSNFILLLVGASGSGKTAAADRLHMLFGWRAVESYTTRPRRNDMETGHRFVSDEEFDELVLNNELVAYTEYNGYNHNCSSFLCK